MLVRFVHIDALYRLRDAGGQRAEYLVDMVQLGGEVEGPRRRDAYRHVGDFALFTLGFFPERLQRRGRKAVGPDYFAEQGRGAYGLAAETEGVVPPTSLLRMLAETFETCVVGVNRVKRYTHDPFYQYMLRQFGIA